MFLGFIFIIIGITFLLKNLGYISQDAWNIIWPAILILVGIWILFKGRFQGLFLAPLENFWEKEKKSKESE